MTKHIVGIVPSLSEYSVSLNRKYINFAREAMQASDIKVVLAEEEVAKCDTVLLIGGNDVDPTLFGQNNYASRDVYPEMDNFHISCIAGAVARGKNIFGICRGFQLLSYYFLFSRYDKELCYLQDVMGHNQKSSLDLARSTLSHSVHSREGNTIFVNSMHHQAVSKFEGPWNPSFITHTTRFCAPKNPEKIIIEGFKFKFEGSNVAGVQWHPEELDSKPEFYQYFLQDTEFLPEV